MRPQFQVYSAQKYPKTQLFSSWNNGEIELPKYVTKEENIVIKVLEGCVVKADTMVVISHIHKPNVGLKMGVLKQREKLFKCTFHTSFIENNHVQFDLNQLDDISNKKKNGKIGSKRIFL